MVVLVWKISELDELISIMSLSRVTFKHCFHVLRDYSFLWM